MAAPSHHMPASSAPARYAASVTPGQALAKFCDALYIGGSGDLVLRMADGEEQLYPNVPVGVFSVGTSMVVASGTTATGIVALWN